MSPKIKICGITNLSDAIGIIDLGIDVLGFIFAESKRRIDLTTARDIISKLPSFVCTVGVFVNQDKEFIRKSIDYAGINLIQLHGDEDMKFCERFFPRVIKVIRAKDRDHILEHTRYSDVVRAFLLDTYRKDAYGGTGESFDWNLAIYAMEVLKKPLIVAGGITPQNCGDLLKKLKPYGIDVSSGVEICPGKKDLEKVRKLVSVVRELEF